MRNVLSDIWGDIDEDLADMFIHKLEWTKLRHGECLYKAGDKGDCMHILISGRLKAIKEDDASQIVLGEISCGECVGETSLISDAPRNASIYAVRNSTLIKITKSQFDEISDTRPKLLKQVAKTVIKRLSSNNIERRRPAKIANIAIMPVSSGLDMERFTNKFQSAIQESGKVFMLNQQNLKTYATQLGIRDFGDDTLHNLNFTRWLDKLEEEYDFILYIGYHQPNAWSQCCVRQADKIILVSDFYDFDKSALEEQLLDSNDDMKFVSRSLVLLHADSSTRPIGTKRHLEQRRVDFHHHIRWDNNEDFNRLGRFINRRAVGLVLGGGGAKGFAHIGIIQRLMEAGVPIDFVGGTSIGAVIAGQVAMGYDGQTIYDKSKAAFLMDKPLSDYTLPLISVFAGRKLDRTLRKYYGESNIEDQWLNFFCVSSNLTKADMCVHKTGLFWNAIRASLSIPGALPPVVLGNDLLVDGALMNNLPIDLMAENPVNKIIGVDLKESAENQELNYTEMPGCMGFLTNKFSSRRRKLKVPGLMNILSKSTILASYEKADRVRALADLYINPPVSQYGLLDFKKFDQIVDIGYKHMDQLIKESPEIVFPIHSVLEMDHLYFQHNPVVPILSKIEGTSQKT